MPSVEQPPLSKREQQQERKIGRIKIKIDGKDKPVKNVALRCPDCFEPLDFTNDFFLWIVCNKCAEQLKEDGVSICKPFSKWSVKTAKTLCYRLDIARLKIESA